MRHSIPETKEAECQTVLQCTPHLLPKGQNTTVQSDADIQTIVTFTLETSDAKIVSQLTYTDPNEIDRDALREIDTDHRLRATKLKWQLPSPGSVIMEDDSNVSISSQNEEETQTERVPGEECPGVPESDENYDEPVEQTPVQDVEEPVQGAEEPVQDPEEPEQNFEAPGSEPERDVKDEMPSKSSATSYQPSQDLKSILRPSLRQKVDVICQTNLMVFPHMLSTTENVMVTSELAAQTSVTCVPEGSISDIIPMLKTYLVHDGAAIATSGDSQENTSVLDMIQDLIKQVDNSHSHMFDPDYIPPTVPANLISEDDWNDEIKHSDNDYFLHILDTILTSAAEPIEDRPEYDDITSVDDDYLQTAIDQKNAAARSSSSAFGFKIKILVKNGAESECPANAQPQNNTCFEFIVKQTTEADMQNNTCTKVAPPGKEIVMPMQTGEMMIESCNANPIQITITDLCCENQTSGDSPPKDKNLSAMTDSVVKLLPEVADESTCEYCSVGQNRKSRVSFAEPITGPGRCTCSASLPNICAVESEQLKDEANFKAEVEKINTKKHKCAANADTDEPDTEELDLEELEELEADVFEPAENTKPNTNDDYKTCSEGPCTALSKCNIKQPKKTQSLPAGADRNVSTTDKLGSCSVPCVPLTIQITTSRPPSPKTPDTISVAYSSSRCAALDLPEVCQPDVCAKGTQADPAGTDWAKPDPIALALKACDEGFKPLKQAINQMHQKLMMLNVPELDCIYKKSTPDTTFTKKTVFPSSSLNTNNFQTFGQSTTTCKALKNTNTQTSYNKSYALTTIPNTSYTNCTSCSSDYSSRNNASGSSYKRYGSQTNSSMSSNSSYGQINTKHAYKKQPQRQRYDDRSNYSSQGSSETTCTSACSESDSYESNPKKKTRHKRSKDLGQGSSTSIVLSLKPCTTSSGTTTVQLDKCFLHNSKKGSNRRIMFHK